MDDVWSDNILSFLGPDSRRREIGPVRPCHFPIEPYVHGLGLLLAEFFSCDAYRNGIVHLDGCGSLFPSHLREGGADGYRCLGVDEYGAVLCFVC